MFLHRDPLVLAPVLVAAPAEAPVSLAEAKAHLRVEHDEDDTLLAVMIDAATQRLDGRTGILRRCLMRQTWRVDLSGFPRSGIIPLPVFLLPAVSITVAYTDAGGTVVDLAAGDAALLGTVTGPVVRRSAGIAWPLTAVADDAVRITCVCGSATAADVPAPIRSAILLMVGDLYRNRETTGQGSATLGAIPMSTTVEALLAPYRRGLV